MKTITATIIAGAALLLIACEGQASENGISSSDRLAACLAAEEFVERRLVSPGTADHQGCRSRTVSQSGNRYTVSGYVDSQNRAGGTIRSEYRVVMTRGGGNWTLDDISINER